MTILIRNSSIKIFIRKTKQLNIIHYLKSASYNFSTAFKTFENHFALRYTNNTLGKASANVLENSIIIYNDSKLNVKLILEQIKEVIKFDVLGRILVKPSKVKANHLISETLSPYQTALIVKFRLKNNVVVNKKDRQLKSN